MTDQFPSANSTNTPKAAIYEEWGGGGGEVSINPKHFTYKENRAVS